MTVVSHGAGRQANAFKKSTLSVEPVHKMDHQQCRSLIKMCMPVVGGPESRHGFASFEEKTGNSFLKFNPFTSPAEPDYPLFPHQDDVPLVEPCSSLVSPAADADLKPRVGRAVECLVDCSDWKPHQRVPITGERSQPAHRRQMILLEETSQDRRWNSRAVSTNSDRQLTWLSACVYWLTSQYIGDSTVTAGYGLLVGWRTPVKVASALPDQNHIFAFCMDPNLKESSDPSARWREEKERDYFYKSNTQRAAEDIPWGNIVPNKIQPPESTVEVLTGPLSQCFTKRKYFLEPEISQVIGGFWDRFQMRSFTSPQRPVDLVSRSSRTCHIPLYIGCVDAVNFEDVDNADVDLSPLHHVQTSKPCCTSTAHTPHTPGKVHWSATHPANSYPPSTTPSIIAQMHGYIAKHGSLSHYNHQGRFSQMVTPVSPQNSFNKRERETITV
ncbi:protein SPMIP7 [Morus bassanus]